MVKDNNIKEPTKDHNTQQKQVMVGKEKETEKEVDRNIKTRKKNNPKRKVGHLLKVKNFLWSKQKVKHAATKNLKEGVNRHKVIEKLKTTDKLVEHPKQDIGDLQSATNNMKGGTSSIEEHAIYQEIHAPVSANSVEKLAKGGQIMIDPGSLEVIDDSAVHRRHGPDIQRGKQHIEEHNDDGYDSEYIDSTQSDGFCTKDEEEVADSLIEAFTPIHKEPINLVEKEVRLVIAQ